LDVNESIETEKDIMKKKFVFVLIVLAFSISSTAIAMDLGQNNVTISANRSDGPAPSSGDGVPDGSGKDSPHGPFKGN